MACLVLEKEPHVQVGERHPNRSMARRHTMASDKNVKKPLRHYVRSCIVGLICLLAILMVAMPVALVMSDLYGNTKIIDPYKYATTQGTAPQNSLVRRQAVGDLFGWPSSGNFSSSIVTTGGPANTATYIFNGTSSASSTSEAATTT